MNTDYNTTNYFKGRGSQIKPQNKFLHNAYVTDHVERLDEPLLSNPGTLVFVNILKRSSIK